jgi:soluble lytic murein transglycosylase-like protein
MSGADVLARFDAVASRIPFAAQIRQAAVANGIDPALLAGLVYEESGFNPKAVSKCGAQGLTQLMPGTARGLGVTDAFDPQQNLNGGAKYIATQMRSFGRVDLALAAYNAGPAAIRSLGVVPHSKQGYVNVILRKWRSYTEPSA